MLIDQLVLVVPMPVARLLNVSVTECVYDSKMIIKIKRKKKFVMWQNKNCKCLGIDNPSCILAIINVNSVINTI